MYKALIIIILLIILVYFIKINRFSEYFGIPTSDERPFVNVYNDKGEQLSHSGEWISL